MANINHNASSIQFARLASKLEAHLIKHGVPCSDADIIIEESSVLYFEGLRSPKKLVNLIKKQAPIKIFLEAAARAIEMHLPEASGTFGSPEELSKSIY